PPALWIKLTGGSNPYAWTNQKQDTPGTFVDDLTRQGTTTDLPAYDSMGNTSLAAGTIVRAYLDPAQTHYVFHFGIGSAGGGPGSLTVASVNPGVGDATLTISNVGTLQIDQGSGLRLTDQSGGTARIAAQDASFSHRGVVNLNDVGGLVGQILGKGSKAIKT